MAAGLIAERGYERTSLADIALAAGYSHGQTARRFGTKAELLSALVDVLLTDWHEDVVAPGVAAASKQGGLAAVLSVVDAYVDLVKRRPTQVAAVHRIFFEALGPGPLTERIRTLHQRLRGQMADHLRVGVAAGGVRADVDPDLTASVVISALRGASYQWLLDPDGFDLVQVLNGLRHYLATAVEAPAASEMSHDRPF